MRNIILSFLSLAILFSCSNKEEISDDQAETFNKLFGNAGNDKALDIKELPDGNFLIFGSTETQDQGIDMLLIKADKFGNELWSETFGGPGDDKAGGCDISESGNIIMVGTRVNEGTSEGDPNHTDIFIVEYDQFGTEIQSQIFNDNFQMGEFNDNEEGNVIMYDNLLGGYIIGGSSDAQVQYTDAEGTFVNEKGTKNIFIVRVLFENGNTIVNTNNAGYDGDDFVSTGTYVSEIGDDTISFLFGGTSFFEGYNQACFIPVVNRNENPASLLGIKHLPDQNVATTTTSITSFQNQFLMIGNFQDGGSNRIFLARINSLNQEPEFSYPKDFTLGQITKSGSIRGYKIYYKADDNNFVISGSTNSGSNGGFDHYMASIESNGSINWEKTFGGTGDEEALAISPTADGGYVIAGYTGFEGNSLINVIKTNNKGVLNP